MPYIGNVPAEAYSQVSYQDLTGGSGTSFTLDYPVGSAGEIEVFVNNVRQEPTVAYTVNGTALTMTGSIVATDDFYIVFQGKAEKSGTIPEKQANGTYVFPDDVTVSGNITSTGIDDNATSTAVTIDSSGNVGIGTASPTAFGGGFLVSETTGSSGGYSLQSSGSVVTQMAADSTASVGYTGTRSNHAHVFTTNNTERMRVDSSGNLLVGKTSANSDNAGFEANSTGFTAATRSNGTVFVMDRLVSDGGILSFRKDNTTVGSIGTDTSFGKLKINGTGDSGFQFHTNQILPVSSGNSILDNTVDIGNGAVRFKDLYLSGGVYLGGTGSANLLQEYEEGDFTPTASVGTLTFSSARYTKVGEQVTVWMTNVKFSDIANTAQIQINGLPFTSDTGSAAIGTLMAQYRDNQTAITIYNGAGFDWLRFYYNSNTGGFSALPYTIFNSGASNGTYITITYRAA